MWTGGRSYRPCGETEGGLHQIEGLEEETTPCGWVDGGLDYVERLKEGYTK
jgi:hypothetical protein